MTLTQTAILVKQVITISVITLVVGILAFIGYKVWYAYYLANLPPVEEKPDTRFGLLPQPDFPKTNVSTSNFTYSLDTATGGLPKIGIDPGFEKVIKVYFITQTFATLLSPERSQNLAGKFGITSPPEILSETKYKFKDTYKTLTVDLDNGNFSYSNEATMSAQTDLREDNELVAGFKQMLSTLGTLRDDLQNARSKILLFKVAGNELIPEQVRAEATIAQISLWPDQIDKKPILTTDFDKSPINALVIGKSENLDDYVLLNVNYFPIDTSTFATYPLKTAEAAFDDLKMGRGIVIVQPEQPQVSISSVYLGYYLPEVYNPYLQPIYVFEGPNFVGYVSAISEQPQPPATQNLDTSNQ